MKTFVVCTQKGGAGKTVTAHTLFTGLQKRGYSVLGIDLDSQMNFTILTGTTESERDIMDVMQGTPAADAITHTAHGDIIAGTMETAMIDNRLRDREILADEAYLVLRDALKPLNYDYIVIDTPPALSTITLNALAAADAVIIPAAMEPLNHIGVQLLAGTIETIRESINPKLTVDGILCTRYRDDTIISKTILKVFNETAEAMHTKVYRAKIRQATAINEATLVQKSIFDYAPRANVTADCNAWIDEILKG